MSTNHEPRYVKRVLLCCLLMVVFSGHSVQASSASTIGNAFSAVVHTADEIATSLAASVPGSAIMIPRLWCTAADWFGFTFCEHNMEATFPEDTASTTTSQQNPPRQQPPASVQPLAPPIKPPQLSIATPATYITNEYITNPITYVTNTIREKGETRYVRTEQLEGQTDEVLDTVSDRFSHLSEEFETGTLSAASLRLTSLYDAHGLLGGSGMILRSTGTSTEWVATSSLGIAGGGGSLTEEQVEDYAGSLLSGTKTLIAVTYDDVGNVIDFVVEDDLSLYDNTTSAFIDRTDLSEAITGIEYTSATGVFSLTNGYTIPLTASTTEWATAYGWGDHITQGYLTTVDISDDTNLVAGDALTLSGDTINFDGGATPGGVLGGTWATPTIDAEIIALEELQDVDTFTQASGDVLYWDGDSWNVTATSTWNTDTTYTAGAHLTLTGTDIDVDDDFVLNTGDSISGNLTFSGSSANIALGSNWLSGDGGDEGIFVDESGKVGFGTSTPSSRLTVSGDGYITATSTHTAGYSLNVLTAAETFSVASQETNPFGLEFSADGTKMFVSGTSGRDINEYTLSSAFDISTASFVDSFSVESIDVNPNGLAFNGDGTKMFVSGGQFDEIYEYALSTGFDVSTATYVDSFDVGAQDSGASDVEFNADGTKMYVVGNTEDEVNEYTLATAFDVSTASYAATFSVGTQETGPMALAFNDDGTRMYVAGFIGNDINEYALSTAFDITTASFTAAYGSINDPSAILFSDDGTKLYALANANDSVFEYDVAEVTLNGGDLHVEGDVQFSNYGSGTLTFDSNGNITVSSDERLKVIEGGFFSGVNALRGINAIQYHWKESTGFDTETLYTGFSAQNVQEYIPEAVGVDERGMLTLSDRPILATVVNATKEQQAILDVFMATSTGAARDALTAANSLFNTHASSSAVFASTTIASSTASTSPSTSSASVLERIVQLVENFIDGVLKLAGVMVERLTLGTSDMPAGATLYDAVTGDPYCLIIMNGEPKSLSGACEDVDLEQYRAHVEELESETEAIQPISDAPYTIAMLGSNPAEVTLGAAYIDAGAKAYNEVGEILPITLLLNGATTTELHLDTSTSTMHIITYRATDPSGTLLEATRTVYIIAPITATGTSVQVTESSVSDALPVADEEPIGGSDMTTDEPLADDESAAGDDPAETADEEPESELTPGSGNEKASEVKPEEQQPEPHVEAQSKTSNQKTEPTSAFPPESAPPPEDL